MSGLIKLCKMDQVEEDAPMAANPDGFPALAVYRINDEIFVTDNHCTHGMALLTDGYQEGAIIECPFHGGAFNIKTGAAETFPCQTPIKTYPVIVANGYVYVPVDSK